MNLAFERQNGDIQTDTAPAIPHCSSPVVPTMSSQQGASAVPVLAGGTLGHLFSACSSPLASLTPVKTAGSHVACRCSFRSVSGYDAAEGQRVPVPTHTHTCFHCPGVPLHHEKAWSWHATWVPLKKGCWEKPVTGGHIVCEFIREASKIGGPARADRCGESGAKCFLAGGFIWGDDSILEPDRGGSSTTLWVH